MTARWLAVGPLAVALLTGCTSAPTRWSSVPRTAPDPDRWDRALCRVGEYPVELDSRALAWALYDDLRAGRSSSGSPAAAARLHGDREAFDARCAAWRAVGEGAAVRDEPAQVPVKLGTSL